MSSRSKDFKKGVTETEGRRRREASALSLRKDKKEEGLSKRRNLGCIDTGVDAGDVEPSDSTSLAAQGAVTSKQVYTVSDIPTLFAGLRATDLATQLESLRGFRRLLSMEKNAPIQACIDSDCNT